jgi:hypothetical protein
LIRDDARRLGRQPGEFQDRTITSGIVEKTITLVKPDEQRLWVRRFRKSGDGRTRLVCFPHAGGSASYFFSAYRRLCRPMSM